MIPCIVAITITTIIIITITNTITLELQKKYTALDVCIDLYIKIGFYLCVVIASARSL
jgi:hypothetical protein